MRLLVTEFISGGGFVNDPLPRGLKQEGLHMMQALVADCMRINDCQVTATIDPRIQFDNEKLTRATIHSNAHYRDQVFELAKNFDLVWVIAPESEGVLGELVNQLLVDKNILVNCEAESIRIGGDK